ncbi:hypothetical protein GL263_17160 [Streptomyces durbertensis]|uniref:PH domain-containing protein n=1 Tax=Streptomyces durbertensis TaxID=2448886 RepID=A0ABR6EIW6_9ACTN|nr:hypothetical protein [Streptomyces durbertensis]MBB1245286.1 hypothetical protein [Streptomyces durbertensis]
MPLTDLLADETVERKSQEVTDWGARIGWTIGTLLFIALLYWLMRRGWQRRAALHGDLPAPQELPAEPGSPRLTLTGRYHASTTAGQWLDRVVAHGLGTRSQAELTLTEQGLSIVRPGAADFFVPADALRGARLDTGIAGKVLTQGGLLVITWQLGDQQLDSGFRADHPAEHHAWVKAINELSGGPADAAATHHQEGAR